MILVILLPANQDSAEAVEPAVGAFHHPSAGLAATALLPGFDLLASRTKVGLEAKEHAQFADDRIIVALVQA